MADPDLVDTMFTDLHIWRVREADFEVGGRRYRVFAGAREPAPEWLRLKAERAARVERAVAATRPSQPHLQRATAPTFRFADALEATRERGIVHRDPKPANAKVRADGTVKPPGFV